MIFKLSETRFNLFPPFDLQFFPNLVNIVSTAEFLHPARTDVCMYSPSGSLESGPGLPRSQDADLGLVDIVRARPGSFRFLCACCTPRRVYPLSGAGDWRVMSDDVRGWYGRGTWYSVRGTGHLQICLRACVNDVGGQDGRGT